MRKFLASAALLIPYPTRKNPLIWSEFRPNLQKTYIWWFYVRPFVILNILRWWAQKTDKSNYSQFSLKKFPRPICPKIKQPCIWWSTLMTFLNIVVLRSGTWRREINISQFFKKKNFCKGRWVICVQIGPKQQHLVSHDLR